MMEGWPPPPASCEIREPVLRPCTPRDQGGADVLILCPGQQQPVTWELVGNAHSQQHLKLAESENEFRKISNLTKVTEQDDSV